MGLPLPAIAIRHRFASTNASQKIWMSKVSCTGNEQRFDECSHSGWGIHTCTHAGDTGLACNANSKRSRAWLGACWVACAIHQCNLPVHCTSLLHLAVLLRAVVSLPGSRIPLLHAVQLRLVNQTGKYSGRLEVAVNGVWGRVSATGLLWLCAVAGRLCAVAPTVDLGYAHATVGCPWTAAGRACDSDTKHPCSLLRAGGRRLPLER